MITHTLLLLSLASTISARTSSTAVTVYTEDTGWRTVVTIATPPYDGWGDYEASLPPPSPWCWVPRFGVAPPPERPALVLVRQLGAAREQQPERGRLAYRVSERMRRPIA